MTNPSFSYTRIVKPVSRIVGDSVTPGTQVEFRWRSSSSAYHNPRESLMLDGEQGANPGRLAVLGKE